MSDPSARTFHSDFKRFFLRGLVILLPSVLTIWIVVKAYQFIDSAIAGPINQALRAGLRNLAPHWKSAGDLNDWWETHWYMNLIGLTAAIVVVYFTGYLLGGFLGKRFYRHIERAITTLPVFKQVYPYVKQVVDFLFSDEKTMKFNRVVMIEYPRKGLWSVGFQTGSTLQAIQDHAGDCVTVFIPSSPPISGYTVTIPREEVIELPITVEEAIRFVVSGGVLVPESQKVETLDISATISPAIQATPAALPHGKQRPRNKTTAAAGSRPPNTEV